ncbi:MAG: N-acetylglucosamine-6-phosphate deacetylase [Alphaproteobacteria bacterium]|nr:N-acetylglucosamine-6-phosphate deacetylase [Alphaproteobacteria bacterium]
MTGSTVQSLDGRILTVDGWLDGRIDFDTKIRALDGQPSGEGPCEAYVIPGFVDLHVPGGGGGEAMGGAAGVRQLARLHARHGTTSLAPASVTAPADDLLATARGIAEVQADRQPDEARVLGAHIEGPFLNPKRLGAQPPFIALPDLTLIDRLAEIVDIQIVTLAPEVDGAVELIRHLAGRGVAVQIGHSDATYDETLAALEAGARGFTHLFNAMSALHHRAPGVTGAALAHATYAALIPDLVHVHPGAIRAALRAIPKLFFVTDAVAAAGMPDGPYPLGRRRVTKMGDAVYSDEGSATRVLAGSALTMDRALQNLVEIGLPLADAVRRLATLPAEFIGLDDRGVLAPGNWADIVVLDDGFNVTGVIVEGQAIDLDG